MEGSDGEEDHEEDNELMGDDIEYRAGAQPVAAAELFEHGIVVQGGCDAKETAGEVLDDGEDDSVDEEDCNEGMDDNTGFASSNEASWQRAFRVSKNIGINILEIIHDSEGDQKERLDDHGPEELAERKVLGSIGQAVVGGEDITCCCQEVDKEGDALRKELEPGLVARELDKDVDLPTAGCCRD